MHVGREPASFTAKGSASTSASEADRRNTHVEREDKAQESETENKQLKAHTPVKIMHRRCKAPARGRCGFQEQR